MKYDSCGERLKKLREDWGLNMKQMAQKLNMPYTTYVGYEKERERTKFNYPCYACCLFWSIGRLSRWYFP